MSDVPKPDISVVLSVAWSNAVTSSETVVDSGG